MLKDTELFRTTVSKLLDSHPSNFVDTLDKIPDTMLAQLGGTLLFWSKRLNVNSTIEDLFMLTKILEALSFWEGFMSAGGVFPQQNNGHSIPKQQSVEIVPNSESCCIIPIGNLNSQIEKIIQSTLSEITTCERIKTIVLVFDGIENTLDYEHEKIDTIEVASRRGPAFCRNLGIKKALDQDSDILFLLDSDVILHSGQPNQLIDLFLNSNSHIGLPLVESCEAGWMSQYHDVNGSLNGRYIGKHKLLYATSCCTLISRRVFENGSLFSTDFRNAAGEDIDFSLRCLKDGFSISGLDSIKIHHWYGYTDEPMHDFEILTSRFHRYGAGECELLKKHPDYYSLLEQSKIRATGDILSNPRQQWSQLLQSPGSIELLLQLVQDGD